MQKYQIHEREYTILGISSCFHSLTGEKIEKLCGAAFPEVISLIVNGAYFMALPVDGRKIASHFIIQKFKGKALDLPVLYEVYEKEVLQYQNNILLLPSEKFSLQTMLDFFDFYEQLLPTYYIGIDAIDFMDPLTDEEQKEFSYWVTKIRHIGEFIYKRGEMEFIPRYLAWFSEQYAREYSVDLLQYVVFTEMKDFINNKTPLPSVQELEQRKRCFYMSEYAVGQIEYCSGDQAQKMIEQKELFEKDEKAAIKILMEVQGKVAYPGKIEGKVCIVKNRADMNKFQDGDIIVSQMTDPSYLPIMKRALAFVTDEGGTLCHAAIVARELHKPCVTGTKYATLFFHDGDVIEVNADQGSVKKI